MPQQLGIYLLHTDEHLPYNMPGISTIYPISQQEPTISYNISSVYRNPQYATIESSSMVSFPIEPYRALPRFLDYAARDKRAVTLLQRRRPYCEYTTASKTSSTSKRCHC